MKRHIRFCLSCLGILAMYLILGSFLSLPLLYVAPFSDDLNIGDAHWLLSELVSLVVVICVAWIWVRMIFRGTLQRAGMRFSRGWLRHWLVGLASGAALVTLCWALIMALGGYTIAVGHMQGAKLLVGLGTMLLVGYGEEVLCRGIMAYAGRGLNRWFVALFVGVLFSLMHIANPGYNWLSMLSTLLVAVAFAQLTWISGDLWMAIGAHSAWNFVMGSVLGVSVSGTAASSPLISVSRALDWLSGGTYGLEASVVCSVVLLGAVLLLQIVYISKDRINHDPVMH